MGRTRAQRGHFGRPYLRLRSQILMEESDCYLCGKYVDQTLNWKNPGAPQIHFVIPISQGGSWRDRRNGHLAHASCNRRQSDHWDGTVDHSQGPRNERGEAYTWVAFEDP